MPLPTAEQFRALLTAARDCGVTKCEFAPDGSIRFEMAPVSPGERVVNEINAATAGQDPLDVIRRQVSSGNELPPVRDLLDLVANGARVVQVGNGDPTRPE